MIYSLSMVIQDVVRSTASIFVVFGELSSTAASFSPVAILLFYFRRIFVLCSISYDSIVLHFLQRFCALDKKYVEKYEEMFMLQYETCHRLDPTKLRNVSKFFGHLLHTDSISWGVFQVCSSCGSCRRAQFLFVLYFMLICLLKNVECMRAVYLCIRTTSE